MRPEEVTSAACICASGREVPHRNCPAHGRPAHGRSAATASPREVDFHYPYGQPNPSAVFGLDGRAEILDACCGGRHWWWDKDHPLAIYMDVREEPKGSCDVRPNFEVAPTCKGDFRNMPFEDESFQLVVFDPPHLRRSKPSTGYMQLKYGALPHDTEQQDLRLGFRECWRVLRPGGTLVFKWADKLDRVAPHFPATPIVGTRSPRGGQTRWFIFYKPLDAALEAAA